jgi:hypothetical protein
MINPYHLNPGILLDVDITSIKRKKVTLDAMANVLNEFLHGVSKGFADAAFASFSRRRSTVREDINQSFGAADDTPAPAAEPGMDIVSSSESAPSASDEPRAIAAPRKGRKAGGVVDAGKGKRGRKAGAARKAADVGISEV